jgi:hypothetical protein
VPQDEKNHTCTNLASFFISDRAAESRDQVYRSNFVENASEQRTIHKATGASQHVQLLSAVGRLCEPRKNKKGPTSVGAPVARYSIIDQLAMAMKPAAVVAVPPANAIDIVIVITIAQAITEAQSKRDAEAKAKIPVTIAVTATMFKELLVSPVFPKLPFAAALSLPFGHLDHLGFGGVTVDAWIYRHCRGRGRSEACSNQGRGGQCYHFHNSLLVELIRLSHFANA